MSYDLFFYRKKTAPPTRDDIAQYLNKNLTAENHNQWFFENEDTEVYFSFDFNLSEEKESYAGFGNTFFSFNLNFLRPSFFGLEAFNFVERFITDLDLFIDNPQSSDKEPYRSSKDELFENWNSTNLRLAADYYEESKATYCPPEKSNAIWFYNLNRARLQAEAGDEYFVPKMFYFATIADNEFVTVSTWTQHVPMVIPPADYFLLGRETDSLLIDRGTLLRQFGEYFDDFHVEGCAIIHPNKAEKAKKIFNAIQSDLEIETTLKRIGPQNLFNAK